MSQPVIQVEELSKRYVIGERAQYTALRHLLGDALKAPLRLFRPTPPETTNHRPQNIWALKDVSFKVEEGEVLGLIGRNGAGKSTLLKILARITRPTSGHAEIHGRIGSLLEVGTGFHPELTGRENVYLSGAVLGMKKREIDRKFDEIVTFSEVEQFIDTPLKHYSTGMQMRLAFAVAAHLEPEILLVDEVLAVGDLAFQKKCMGKMQEVSAGGRTIVFISHQMNQIRRLCQRVIWVEGGQIRQNGAAHEVVSAYESAMARGHSSSEGPGRGPATKGRFLRWEIVEPRGEEPHILISLGPVTIKFTVEVNQPVYRGHHGIALFTHERQLVWARGMDGLKLGTGQHELTHTFPMLPIRPGPYTWQVSLYNEGNLVDYWDCLPDMVVATETHQHPSDKWNGVLNIPSHFEIDGRGITAAAPLGDE